MDLEDCILSGGKIVLPRVVIEGGALVIKKGCIAAVLEPGDSLPPHLPVRDLGQAWVTPGLIELHIHGCNGLAFDRLPPDPEEGAAALLDCRAYLRSLGITSFVPTLVCQEDRLLALAEAIDMLNLPPEDLPGIYVEGPFVNPQKRGAMPEASISDPDPRVLGRLLNLAKGRMKLMTLAPELPGYREMLARLEAVGVIPCLGHSDCDIERVTLPEGRYSITHLFNSMSPISHKTAGLAMLPFLDHRPFVELNANGVHVSPSALRICASAIDPERLMLISDAFYPAGLPPGHFGEGEEELISSQSGIRYASTGTLVGGRVLAPDLLKKWLSITGSSVPNAVRMLTLTPAQLLGIDGRRGAIAEGLEAKLVVWRGDFEEVAELIG